MKNDTKIGFILTYFHNSTEGYELLKKNASILSKENYYFIIASHSPLPSEIQEICDFYFYQQKNVVDDRKYSHGVAESNLIEISLNHLKSQGIHWTYKVSYDIEVNDVSRFNDWQKNFDYDFVSCKWGNNIVCTNSFFANIDFLLNNIDFYSSIEEMFSVNTVLENCWEKNIIDKNLQDKIFYYENKQVFYGENKIDILAYDYNDISFLYSENENRFYITNNIQGRTIKKFRIFDYYSDTLIDAPTNAEITSGITWWFSPPMAEYVPSAKNGYYLEVYFPEKTIRKNILVKDFDKKHPLHKKFKTMKFEEIKFNEYSEFSEYQLYKEFQVTFDDIKTYVDVGANYGMSSIPFLTNDIKVYMVDADSYNINILENAFGKNKKVEIIHKAIHTYDGNVDFFEQPGASVVSSIDFSNVNGSDSNRIKKTVQCITPNTLMEKYIHEEYIDLMKIDIEGGEYNFFETITDENLKRINKMVIEYHLNTDQRVMKIVKKLAKNDFRFKLAKWEKQNEDDYVVLHKMGIIYAWK
jgi:FkbM family methyltransferase